jgi:hypothetical protein
MSYAQLVIRRGLAGDFTVSWLAARALLAGENPYLVVRPLGEYPFNAPFYYPLPAALAALPLAWLPGALAGALFFGLSAGLLAYAVLDKEPFRLPLFVSAPFLVAAALAQWSPLMLAGALLPAVSWLWACKPNLGISLFVSRPSWWKLAGIAVFGLASLLVLPGWPLDWRAVFFTPTYHRPPLLLGPFGLLLLLALLRWRDPAARLLLAMALLPQSLWFADQLVLWAVPRSRSQVWLLTVLSWIAYGLWRLETGGAPPASGATHPGRYLLWLLYLPALVLVLLPRQAPAAQSDTPRSALHTRVMAWLGRIIGS